MKINDAIKINLYFRQERDGELFEFVYKLLKDVPARHRAAVLRRELIFLSRERDARSN